MGVSVGAKKDIKKAGSILHATRDNPKKPNENFFQSASFCNSKNADALSFGLN